MMMPMACHDHNALYLLRRWLREEGKHQKWKVRKTSPGLGENTAKLRLGFGRAFFERAVEDELILKNPFKIKGLTVSQTAAQKTYIRWAVIESAVEHCPKTEWKLLFAMTRTIPMRIPSEIVGLPWADVDWERNQILIHPPKTRHIGKHARLVPILETVRPLLEQMFDSAADGEMYVFSNLRTNATRGTTAKKYVTRSKHEVWGNSLEIDPCFC